MSFTEAEILKSIRALEVIAGHPRIALRLIDLARDPSAEVEEYSQLIEKDPSLAGRLLGLVNSAIYSPGAPILTVQRAVCTLGLKSVRELALSHCVASLHSAMALGTEEARDHWLASLAKAIASRKVAECIGMKELDAAFTAGLLQDIGFALLCSIDRDAIREIRGHREWTEERKLQEECAHFGLDHISVGSRIAQRLDLPRCYFEAISTHHAARSFEGRDGFDLAVGVSSLLPHDAKTWSENDLERFKQVLNVQLSNWSTPEEFLGEIQQELELMEEQLGNDSLEPPNLLESLMYASQENARSTYTAAFQTAWLREDTNHLNDALDHAERAHLEAELRAERDPLTQLYNRNGWDRRARVSLNQTAFNDGTIGVAFFDLDHFKDLNDEHGHAAGDFFLKEISARMLEAVRNDDLVCRWGGDEFVILFCDVNPSNCLEAARRVKSYLQATPILFGDRELEVSATVGFVSVSADEKDLNLGDLLQIADEQLYKAKAARRGTMSFTRVRD